MWFCILYSWEFEVLTLLKILSDDMCGRKGLKSKVSTWEELYDFFSLELSSQMQRYIKINFKRRFPVQAFAWTLI